MSGMRTDEQYVWYVQQINTTTADASNNSLTPGFSTTASQWFNMTTAMRMLVNTSMLATSLQQCGQLHPTQPVNSLSADVGFASCKGSMPLHSTLQPAQRVPAAGG